MAVYTGHLRFSTEGNGDVTDLTEGLLSVVSSAGVQNGVASVFVPGSTAAVTTMEYEPGGVHDLLGIYDGHAARFVKRYAQVREEMIAGVRAFAEDVRERRYPEPDHGYTMAPDELERLRELLHMYEGEPFTGGPSL